MADNSIPADLKKQLSEWIDHVLDGITNKLIESEQELEAKFRVFSEKDREKFQYNTGAPHYPTLLERLGYTLETCDDHPTVMVSVAGHKQVKTIPDYIVKSSEQKDPAVWELKAPGEDVDNDESTQQIMSYCDKPTRLIPLGILCNGRQLRIFINPDYTGLGKYKKISDEPKESRLFDFRCNPVLSLDLEELKKAPNGQYKQAVEVLVNLSCGRLSGKAVNYARSLAERKLADGRDKERIRKTIECLQESLLSPSDEVIAAVANVIHDWKGLDPQPQPEDAVTAWHRRKDNAAAQPTVKAVETAAKQSINSIVRQKVAEICEKKGWSLLTASEVKGLRYRFEGGNGYHPIPQGEGVPMGLHVGGLSTADAKKVIQQLESLLHN